MPMGRLNTGLGLDVASLLSTAATVATAKKTKTAPGAAPVPSPMELYNEAAPRVITALKQYDALKPKIDFAAERWWLLTLGVGLIAVVGAYAGNVLYHRIHGKKV